MQLDECISRLRNSWKKFCKDLGLNVSFLRTVSVAMKYPCLKRCMHELTSYSSKHIDSFYTERHSFLQRLLIDALRERLEKEGITVKLEAEVISTAGRVDVAVSITGEGVKLNIGNKTVRIEIKGGTNFEISQLIRYLLDADLLVVCLAGRGQSI